MYLSKKYVAIMRMVNVLLEYPQMSLVSDDNWRSLFYDVANRFNCLKS